MARRMMMRVSQLFASKDSCEKQSFSVVIIFFTHTLTGDVQALLCGCPTLFTSSQPSHPPFPTKPPPVENCSPCSTWNRLTMVLTRRDEKIAPQFTDNLQNEPRPASSRATPSSDKSTHSKHSIYHKDDIDSQKKSKHSLTRSISVRLSIGHFVALVAVITVSHGAMQPVDHLEFHALVLLFCTIPLRTILSFTAHSVREPLQRSGIFLALSAPVVFSSHALHVLATRASPHRIRRLIACAAVDICANWLKMTVSAKTPTTEPFAIPISLIYSAADIFLSSVIAQYQPIVSLFYPFLAIRFLYNTSMVLTCSLAILKQEEAKKQLSNAPR